MLRSSMDEDDPMFEYRHADGTACLPATLDASIDFACRMCETTVCPLYDLVGKVHRDTIVCDDCFYVQRSVALKAARTPSPSILRSSRKRGGVLPGRQALSIETVAADDCAARLILSTRLFSGPTVASHMRRGSRCWCWGRRGGTRFRLRVGIRTWDHSHPCY